MIQIGFFFKDVIIHTFVKKIFFKRQQIGLVFLISFKIVFKFSNESELFKYIKLACMLYEWTLKRQSSWRCFMSHAVINLDAENVSDLYNKNKSSNIK